MDWVIIVGGVLSALEAVLSIIVVKWHFTRRNRKLEHEAAENIKKEKTNLRLQNLLLEHSSKSQEEIFEDLKELGYVPTTNGKDSPKVRERIKVLKKMKIPLTDENIYALWDETEEEAAKRRKSISRGSSLNNYF